MRPRHVTIFGRKIPIKYLSGLRASGAMGLYKFDGEIWIDSSLEDSELTVTILHEMFHAVVHRLNIQLNDEQEEMLVDVCAVAIDENFNLTPKKKR